MKNIDFMKEANNVYSTKQYIVAQTITIFEIEDTEYAVTLDRFYKRTKERDKDYSNLFLKTLLCLVEELNVMLLNEYILIKVR